MTAGLRPYPAYKDSGIEWLGEVPEHWEVVPVKRNYKIQLGKMLQNRPDNPNDVEAPYLKAQHVQWFAVNEASASKMWASPYDVEQYGVTPGDLLVCEGGEGGRSGIVQDIPQGFIIQNALHRVRSHDTCLNTYLQYVMSSVSTAGWFDAINNKATIAHFTREKFGSLMMPLPPLPEQTAIVRYLDYVDRRVRRLTRAKRKLVTLLGEQKQAVIHRAVTRGLDPNALMKDSGVEWLRKVPAHWGIMPVKRNYDIQLGKMLQNRPDTLNDIEVPYLKAQHVQWFAVNTASASKMWASPYDVEQYGVTPGDLLVCEGGEGGRSGIVRDIPQGFIIQNALHRVRSHDTCLNTYLQYVMNSVSTAGWFDAINNKATIAHFTREKFGSLIIPLPPLLEQIAIVEYLGKATTDIDAAIDRAHREVELLDEYRTHLIADVVTGKIKVPGIHHD